MTDLPQGWTSAPLGDLVEVARPRVNPGNADGLRFIGMDHVESQTMRLLGTVPASTMKSAAVRFESGDVLYGRLRPYLNKVFRPDFAGLGSAEFIVMTPSARIDGDYLRYVLNSVDFVRFASQLNTGDRPRVDFRQIRDYRVPLPGLVDQVRIVELIEQQASRIHAANEYLYRVLHAVRVLRQSVALAATAGQLVPCDAELESRYETADEYVRRLADARAGRRRRRRTPWIAPTTPLPLGWTWARLTDLGDLDRGKSRHRPRNDPRLYGGEFPFVQTGDIRRSRGAIRHHSQTYNEAGLAQSRLWPTGTLCITIAANIAETAILTYPACFPDSVAGFISSEEATTRWVQVCLLGMKQRLWRLAPATAQKNINLGTLEAIALPLPPPQEQIRIVAEVDRLMSLAEVLEDQAASALMRSRGLRASVLHYALSTPVGTPR